MPGCLNRSIYKLMIISMRSADLLH
jgi:hypothetical protein